MNKVRPGLPLVISNNRAASTLCSEQCNCACADSDFSLSTPIADLDTPLQCIKGHLEPLPLNYTAVFGMFRGGGVAALSPQGLQGGVLSLGLERLSLQPHQMTENTGMPGIG